ncbi:MAG TPA: DUF4914 family protein, partial [Bacteroidales bacterium]|nr:DUF4914 family protein [Bacteroidales bacterium]
MEINEAIRIAEHHRVIIPPEIIEVITRAPLAHFFNSPEEIYKECMGGESSNYFEVQYDLPGKGPVTEVIVHKVSNGISANYTESYMRRRDPETMLIGDEGPTDKRRFSDTYGYEFGILRGETFEWLMTQELGVFLCFAGNYPVGSGGIVIAPLNAAFFAFGLALLQKLVSVEELPDGFKIESVVYVAPPFRHTHFQGKQIVVHNRL